MSSNRDVVGWIDPKEWEHVFNNIFSGDDARIKHGLDVIKIWKCRYTERIPVAIEATLQILSCITAEDKGDISNRQRMSTAISQFIGLLTERVQKGQMHSVPMRQRGELFGIREWMTCLRHEIAHGLLPTFGLLQKGVNFALQWLKICHWDQHMEWNRSKENVTIEKTVHAPELEPILDYIFANSKKTTASKPPISELALLVETMLAYNIIFIPIYVACNMRHYDKVTFCDSVMKQFERILESLRDSNYLETLLTEIKHITQYPYMPKAAVATLVNLILDMSKGSCSNTFTSALSPMDNMYISCDEHETSKITATNRNEHTPTSTWTLCDYDLSECRPGVMPGQKKESLWDSLHGERFTEDDDDVGISCNLEEWSMQVEINLQYCDFDLL